MYIDKNLLFADTATGTVSAASTDYLDSTVATIKLGDAIANDMVWVVKTEAAFTAAVGSPTATFQLQTCDVASFDSTAITLAQTAAFTPAQLTATKIMSKIKVPTGLKRYTRVYKVASESTANAFALGTWSSFFTPDADNLLP